MPGDKISVIIPAHNEEEAIIGCLESLRVQSLQPMEVIVINDASTDGTGALVRSFSKKWSRVKLVTRKKSEGYTYVIETGYKKARGEIIAILDADSIAPKDWLKRLHAAFKQKGVVAAGGSYLPKKTDHIIELVEGIYLSFRNELGNGGNLAGTNMAFRRTSAERLGIFTNLPAFSIDKHIQESFRTAGMRILYQKGNQVLSEVPASLAAYWRQWFRWGKGLAARAGGHWKKCFVSSGILLLPPLLLLSLLLSWYLLILYFIVWIGMGASINRHLKKGTLLSLLVPLQKYIGLFARSVGYMYYRING